MEHLDSLIQGPGPIETERKAFEALWAHLSAFYESRTAEADRLGALATVYLSGGTRGPKIAEARFSMGKDDGGLHDAERTLDAVALSLSLIVNGGKRSYNGLGGRIVRTSLRTMSLFRMPA